MSNRIQIRRDSQSNWNNINPILADGELALEYDTNKLKVGDGGSYWSDLPYATATLPSLATVATSGSYNDLSNKPETLMDILGGWSSADNRRFLRLNSSAGQIEYSSDFRVVPYSSVVYPGGTIGYDKVGDVAFDESGTYYCYQEPNAYTISYSGSNNWTPAGWLRVNSIGTSSTPPQVGDKVTDGTYTSTITDVPAGWGIQYADVRFMLIEISPAVSSWKNGAGDLTLFTGAAPHLNAWAKIGSEEVPVPSHNTSSGVLGQVAYDSSYMYKCVQTSVTEISQDWLSMTYMATQPGFTGNPTWTTQQNGSNTVWLPRLQWNGQDFNSTKNMPQVGWKVTDGVDTRTITSVSRNGGNAPFDTMYTLTLDGTLTHLTGDTVKVIEREGVSGSWKRIAFSSDTW